MTENATTVLRARLLYQSEHRGTKEMDILLGSFARAHLPHMDEAALRLYDQLLQERDDDLYDWYRGALAVPTDKLTSVLSQFLAFRLNP